MGQAATRATTGGTRRRRLCSRAESGASLVEFALLAPLLFAILLGTITGGLALAAKNSMTNAVREGARLGATLHSDDLAWTWDDWADAVTARVDHLAADDLDESEICAQIVDITALPDPEVRGSDFGSACAPATPITVPMNLIDAATSSCIVMVWAHRSADLNAVFFSRTLSLDASVTGIYERRGSCP